MGVTPTRQRSTVGRSMIDESTKTRLLLIRSELTSMARGTENPEVRNQIHQAQGHVSEAFRIVNGVLTRKRLTEAYQAQHHPPVGYKSTEDTTHEIIHRESLVRENKLREKLGLEPLT